jgi:hypothetical protein
MILFPNINSCPIATIHGLDKFLPFLDIPVGKCYEIEVREHENGCSIDILDKNVSCKTVTDTYRYKDR